ncbi:MAG TPA: hypothetical protein VGK94_13060 [Candidatus Polarisedimenticolia bacterium]
MSETLPRRAFVLIACGAIALGGYRAHAFAPRDMPASPTEGFSPLFSRRLEVGVRSMDQPPGSLRVAGGLVLSDPVETPASANPISVCVASGCALSVCLASGCILSGCLGSVCESSVCLGSTCIGSGCAGSACVGSGCLGSVCLGSGCAGSACLRCSSGLEADGAEEGGAEEEVGAWW